MKKILNNIFLSTTLMLMSTSTIHTDTGLNIEHKNKIESINSIEKVKLDCTLEFIEIYPGNYFYSEYTLEPFSASDINAISWTSSDESVATVDDYGTVLGIKKGKTTITGTFSNNIVLNYDLYVLESNQPFRVTGARMKSNTSSSVCISWNHIYSFNRYDIYRSTSENGTYSKIGSVYSDDLDNYNPVFNDTNLESNSTYYYKIKVVNIVSDKEYHSEFSKAVKAMTKAIATKNI